MYSFNKAIKFALVAFCFLFIACQKDTSLKGASIIFEDDKAIGISFSSKLASKNAKVFLKGNLDNAILGDISLNGNNYTFQPVIPFSKGNTYLLYNNDVEVSQFTIFKDTDTTKPELVNIYPSSDIVPENLLKMYFQFSKPMQEVGSALDYISIIHVETQKEVDVFLELSTELWNKEHTQLTLWLDPGRIKTDLIPNKEKGLPIIKGNEYILKVNANWSDAEGNTLKRPYEKTFRVTNRDSKKPEIKDWKILTTLDVLTIHFNEEMDGVLGTKTMNWSLENLN